jgi:hypothetical protein
MDELRLRLEAEQQAVSEKLANVLGRIITDDSATVEVSGEIAPGTLIEICQVALFVTEPLKKVRIKLDKANGKVVCEPLS